MEARVNDIGGYADESYHSDYNVGRYTKPYEESFQHLTESYEYVETDATDYDKQEAEQRQKSKRKEVLTKVAAKGLLV